MSLTIPYKYDIGQIISPFKKDQPRLWQALNLLNTAATDLNTLVGNIQAVCLYERINFEISSNVTDAQRYIVQMPLDSTNTPVPTQLELTKLVISSKTVPSTNDVVDLLVSNDRGTTWASILKTTADPSVTYNKCTLVSPNTLMAYGAGQFSKNIFNTNDFLRIDWISGTPSDDIRVALIGNYVL
jgi:hypothetical protein